MARAPIITHWSLPPQHAGYWPRLGGGVDWPELGGYGPTPGPHIPGLIPGWHDPERHRQAPAGPPVRAPRGAMMGERAPSRTPPRRWDAFRAARTRRAR